MSRNQQGEENYQDHDEAYMVNEADKTYGRHTDQIDWDSFDEYDKEFDESL